MRKCPSVLQLIKVEVELYIMAFFVFVFVKFYFLPKFNRLKHFLLVSVPASVAARSNLVKFCSVRSCFFLILISSIMWIKLVSHASMRKESYHFWLIIMA